MGTFRSLSRGMGKRTGGVVARRKVRLLKTGIVFKGHEILLSITGSDIDIKVLGGEFRANIARLRYNSSFNSVLRSILEASFLVRSNLVKGVGLWN